jgi:hypothetical protein
MALFNDNPTRKQAKYGYGTANRARKSIRLLKEKPKQYQFQVAQTLYHRAKYHKHQTNGMKNAMKVYKKYLKTIKNKK